MEIETDMLSVTITDEAKKPLEIAFTGPRTGMTVHQSKQVFSCIFELLNRTPGHSGRFHHGDCIGSDAQFHELLVWLKGSPFFRFGIDIIVHPPDNPKERAFVKGYTEIRPELPYLERDRAMVDESRTLIAAPRTDQEEPRSGTWATIRYARKQHKSVLMFPGKVKRK